MNQGVDGRSIVDLNSARIDVSVDGHRADFVHWGFYERWPWRNYSHVHSFFEVCYAYAGEGCFRLGDEEHQISDGMLFVARPGDVHEIVSSTTDPLGIWFWAFTLIPGRDGGGELLKAFGSPSTPAVSTAAGQIPDILELLATEAARPRPGCQEVVTALAGTLLVGTARAVVDDTELAPEWPGRPGKLAEQAVRTMRRYVQDNYDRPVSVRDVVAQVHLSERHANRLFRQFTGTSIHAYLTRYRLELAAQRLVEPDLSIKEVARACGYPDVRHFTTAFRRQWGFTPGSARARKGTTQLTRVDGDAAH